MHLRPFAIAAAAGLALALCACVAGGHRGDKPFVAVAATDGVQHVTVIGGSYYFTPARIVVTTNVPVELTLLKERGLLPHTFILNAPEAGIVIAESLSTEPKVVRFTPTRTGSFPFFCDRKIPFSHRSLGMEGRLDVVQ